MMIRDVHIADRPRERLIRQGAESLSNQELIAILLRTGTKKSLYLCLQIGYCLHLIKSKI